MGRDLAKSEQNSQARGRPGPELGPEGFERRAERGLGRSTVFGPCFITEALRSQKKGSEGERHLMKCVFIHSTDFY